MNRKQLLKYFVLGIAAIVLLPVSAEESGSIRIIDSLENTLSDRVNEEETVLVLTEEELVQHTIPEDSLVTLEFTAELGMTVPDAGVAEPMQLTLKEYVEGWINEADDFALNGNKTVQLDSRTWEKDLGQLIYEENGSILNYCMEGRNWTEASDLIPEAKLLLLYKDTRNQFDTAVINKEVFSTLSSLMGMPFAELLNSEAEEYTVRSEKQDEVMVVTIEERRPSEQIIEKEHGKYTVQKVSAKMTFPINKKEMEMPAWKKQELEEGLFLTDAYQAWFDFNSAEETGVQMSDGSIVLEAIYEDSLVVMKGNEISGTISYLTQNSANLEFEQIDCWLVTDYKTPATCVAIELENEKEYHSDEEGFQYEQKTLLIDGNTVSCGLAHYNSWGAEHYKCILSKEFSEKCVVTIILESGNEITQDEIVKVIRTLYYRPVD